MLEYDGLTSYSLPDGVIEGDDEAHEGGGHGEVAVLHRRPPHVQLARGQVPGAAGEQSASPVEHVLQVRVPIYRLVMETFVACG